MKQFTTKLVATSIVYAVASVGAAVALADPQTLGDAVLNSTGAPYTKSIIDKLIVFKVGPKCLAKLGDKNGRALQVAGFVSRAIENWANRVTGESWADIENQDREKNQAMVAAKIDQFRSKFSITVDIEGDDCDNGSGALWAGYLYTAVTALNAYPLDVPSLAITIKARKAARTVTYTVAPDGTAVEYTAARDITPPQWSEIIERPFRQRASGFSNDYAYQLFVNSNFVNGVVLDKLFTFNVGPACRAKLANPTFGGIHAASFFTRDVAQYAKHVTGDDWYEIETQSAGTKESNRAMVIEMITSFRSRFSFKISVDGPDCDATMNTRWFSFINTVATALRDQPPTGKTVNVELKLSKAAKDIKITATKDGSKISIVAPLVVEPADWTAKLQKPFAKFPRM